MATNSEHPTVTLERRGWDALSGDSQTATEFYADVLDRNVLMLMPGGLRLDSRDHAIEAMSGQPWATYELSDVETVELGADGCLVAYTVTATREGADQYAALVSSGYVRRGDDWRLAFHQQTPT